MNKTIIYSEDAAQFANLPVNNLIKSRGPKPRCRELRIAMALLENIGHFPLTLIENIALARLTRSEH